MTGYAIGAGILLAAIVVAAAVLWHGRSADVLLRSAVLAELVVTLSDGNTFRGLLRRVDERTVVLVDAALLTPPERDDQPVDGELVLPRARIAYMQRT